MPSILGYWDIRGLAEAIRFVLHYVGEEFEDKYYSVKVKPGPEYDRSEWLDVKFTLGLDFPNLPYYIDGELQITQTNAILSHLARKYNLYGETEKEKSHVDMLLNLHMDFSMGMARICYNADFSKLKDGYLTNLPKSIALVEKYLGDKNWFVGSKITVADFVMYEVLDKHCILSPSCLDESPKLQAFIKRFESEPKINAFMNSEKHKKLPLNNKMAAFGSSL